MKRSICLLLAASMLVPGVLGGCASKQQVESVAARTRQENEEQRQKIQQLEQLLADSRQQLQEQIEKSNQPVAERAADTWVELNALRQEFAKLKGEVEVMRIRMDRELGQDNASLPVVPPTVAQRLEAIEFAMDNQLHVDLPTAEALNRIKEYEKAQLQAANATDENATGAASLAAAPAQAQQTTKQQRPSADPAKALYDRAFEEYKAGNFEQARSYWAEFSDTFPKHPYRASALFWQGQCYYKLKDYGRAALLYDDVINKYPKSEKVPGAMLKQGYSLQNLGSKDGARAAWTLLRKKFPKSKEAALAEKALKELK